MIVIKLWGGLGNQLFQYSYGYQLSRKINTELVLDISWYKTQKLSEPEILKLNIQYDQVENVWEKDKIIKFFNNKLINIIIRIPNFGFYQLKTLCYFKETRFNFNSRISEFSMDNVYLDGYWQCPQYFSTVKPQLIELFKPSYIEKEIFDYGQKLKKTKSVAIHVRRGDYPKKKVWYSRLSSIGNEYYKKTIKYIQSELGECNFYLFSNDIDRVSSFIHQIIEKEISSIDIGRPLSSLEEWYLMSCCQNQIIGNSTFSWWAAYLNDNLEKIVCAPNKYMGNDNIIPDDWLMFDV